MNKPKIAVAVADAHIYFREGISSVINNFSTFQVTVKAETAPQLIARLENSLVLPKICIVDIQMLALNEIEVLPIIKSRWPTVNILAMTTLADNHDAKLILEHEAIGLLSKNIEVSELYNLLHSFAYNRETKILHTEYAIKITKKEKELMALIGSNLTYKEIAAKMSVSTRTVETHRDHLFEKFNVNSRSGLIMAMINLGLIHHSDDRFL